MLTLMERTADLHLPPRFAPSGTKLIEQNDRQNHLPYLNFHFSLCFPYNVIELWKIKYEYNITLP